MSGMTTQLLSSGEFCKLRYDTAPVKSTSVHVSFYTNNSKMPKFWVMTLLSQKSDILITSYFLRVSVFVTPSSGRHVSYLLKNYTLFAMLIQNVQHTMFFF